MFEKCGYVLRFLLKRFREQKCPYNIALVNNLPEDKKKYITGWFHKNLLL